jgi:hypothetical protein
MRHDLYLLAADSILAVHFAIVVFVIGGLVLIVPATCAAGGG